MRPVVLPPHASGLRIGLFGGTFDPPHEAHLSVARMAIKRLGLDFVWWLVTPGNPLKDRRGLAPLAERLAAARRLACHPRIIVTGFEADLGVHYTYETVRYLRTRCPGVRFVWLMGADNLKGFHRWRQWRNIARTLPIAVVDRAGLSFSATAGLAATALAGVRVPEAAARTLPGRRPPAWVYLHGLKSPLSSTALRAGHRHRPVASKPDNESGV